jgi:hypothetical protein
MVRRVIYFVRRVKAYLIEGCGAQGKIKLYQYMLPNAILIVFHNISKIIVDLRKDRTISYKFLGF